MTRFLAVGVFGPEALDPVSLELPIEVALRDSQGASGLPSMTTYRVEDPLDVVPLQVGQGGKGRPTLRRSRGPSSRVESPWKVFWTDLIPFANDESPLHRMEELPDVSWPVVPAKKVHGLRPDTFAEPKSIF